MRMQRIAASAVVIAVWVGACSSADSGGSEDSSGRGGSIQGSAGRGGTHGGSGYAGSFGYGGGAGALGYGGSSGSSGATGVAGSSEGEEDAGADSAEGGDASACDGLDTSKNIVFFLSADDSNSMASPAIARRFLNQGLKAPAGFIRTYEFLNYYNIRYPAAAIGTLAIVPELRAATEAGSLELGIGVVSEPAKQPRRPIVLTLVLDTSGSMGDDGGNPITLERAAVKALAQQLKAGDLVSAVTWNTQNAVLLDSYAVSGPSDPKLSALADGLSPGGGTNLNGGLSAGYTLAQKNFDPSRLNRVVLISDGLANAGITDEKIIGDAAMANDGEGVYLVGVGVGAGVNDTLMNTVTDAGRGAYVYLDSVSEAYNVLSGRFDETMDVAARAVQVELRLPWYMGISKFYGEEYSTNPKEIEPQHLAPNDAMVFDQLLKPCSSSVFSTNDAIEIIARWQVPVVHVEKQVSVTTTFGALQAITPKYLPKAAAIVAYAEALKDPTTGAPELEHVLSLVESANTSGFDPELGEIAGLVEKALSIY